MPNLLARIENRLELLVEWAGDWIDNYCIFAVILVFAVVVMVAIGGGTLIQNCLHRG